MNNNWAESIGDFLLDRVATLPLFLGRKTRNKFGRAICLLLAIGWVPPAIMVVGLLLLPLLMLAAAIDYMNEGF